MPLLRALLVCADERDGIRLPPHPPITLSLSLSFSFLTRGDRGSAILARAVSLARRNDRELEPRWA